MNLNNRNILAIIYFLAIIIFLIFHHSVIEFYFFQDDFFEINISRASGIISYFKLFIFRDDIIAYRPISLQNYFFISNYLFGLNPIGFRLISTMILLLSSFLITQVIKKITNSSKAGIITAFFWLTSSIHFMSLAWIAAAYNIIGTFFFLLTSWYFLKFYEFKNNKYYSLALISFLFTIGSYEFSITWPIIFFLYLIINKQPFTKSLKLLGPFFAVSVIYLIARFLFIKVPQINEYKIALNLDSLKALIWYVLWSFNIPEEFKKQVTHNLFFLNQDFIWQYWTLISCSTIFLFWIIFLTIVIPTFRFIKLNLKPNIKIVVFLLSWFFIAISPVLLIPNHTFIMYLTLSSIGIYSLLGLLLATFNSQLLIFISLSIWIASSYSTISFYKENFWMIEAQKVASKVTSDIKKKFPSLPTNSAVLYYQPYNWQIQALSNMESIKTIYNDQSLLIYYNKESLLNDYKMGKISGYVFIY